MDELDIKIVQTLIDKGEMRNYDLAKAVFDLDVDARYELQKKDAIIRYRMNGLEQYGFVRRKKTHAGTFYYVPMEEIQIGEATVRVNGGDPEPIGMAILIKDQDRNHLVLLDINGKT